MTGSSRRLSVLDSTFLRIETSETPMHVGTLQIFSLPDGAGPTFVADLVAEFRAPGPLRAPFNQVLTGGAVARLVPGARIVDELDWDYHVRHTALPVPGGERELGDLISYLHSTPLDRARPLWTCHVIEGLAGDRFAVYVKAHHALTDGVNGIRIASDQLALTPDGASWAPWQQAPPRDEQKPRRERTPRSRTAPHRAVQEVGRGLVGLARRSSAAEPVRVPFEAPASVLNERVTNARRVATQQLDLPRVQQVATAAGVSLNDVFVAICGAAVRRYLQERDALPTRSLVAGVPVSLREPGSQGGNAVGFVWSALGTDVADPHDRLAVVARSMDAAKHHLRAMSGSVRPTFTLLTMALPVAVLLSGQGARVPRPPMNVTISNVPGPSGPRYLNGARLEAFYPVSVLFQGQGLNITCVSYAGNLDVGVVGTRDGLPHLQRIAVYLGEALDELAATEPTHPTPTEDS